VLPMIMLTNGVIFFFVISLYRYIVISLFRDSDV
jgi:hypothetical protein